jgi:hypothetical protein
VEMIAIVIKALKRLKLSFGMPDDIVYGFVH